MVFNGELAKRVGEQAQRVETTPDYPTRVIYAGTSRRREQFLVYRFAAQKVEMYDGGAEEDTPDVSRIMHAKIDHVASHLFQNGSLQPGEPTVILAADTRTNVMRLDSSGAVVLESRGKPTSAHMVQDVFSVMAQIAESNAMPPFYVVEAASGALYHQKGHRVDTKQGVVVELDLDAVKYLSTPEGFASYLAAFNSFYEGPAYASYGLAPIGVTDLSAGLSLPVLTRIGAVQRVDRVPVDDPAFPDTFKQALFTAAIGISPRVFHPIENGTAQQATMAWSWLDEVADQSLPR